MTDSAYTVPETYRRWPGPWIAKGRCIENDDGLIAEVGFGARTGPSADATAKAMASADEFIDWATEAAGELASNAAPFELRAALERLQEMGDKPTVSLCPSQWLRLLDILDATTDPEFKP